METLKKVGIFVAIFLIAGTSWAGRARWLKITHKLMVGTQTASGTVTFLADSTSEDTQVNKAVASQTGDLIDFQDTSGNTLAKIAVDGDLTAVDGTFTGNMTVTGTFAPTGAATFSGQVTVNDNLLVDNDAVSDVAVRIDGTSGQAVDVLQVRAYDGTEYLDVSSSGHTGVKNNLVVGGTLGVTGNTTLTGTLSVVDGTSFDNYMAPNGVTADPCGTYPNGSIFWNLTSGIPCYCSNAGEDLKMSDNSACF